MTVSTAASAALFDRASAVIPGGVNSPVRAFRPSAARRASSPARTATHLTDADGNDYVDLVCSWGPMILGHAHPDVVEAVRRSRRRRPLVRRPDRR